jgi:hypothetical protein
MIRMQVNIQVNNTTSVSEGQIVEASVVPPVQDDELAAYRIPLLPGGKLPPE